MPLENLARSFAATTTRKVRRPLDLQSAIEELESRSLMTALAVAVCPPVFTGGSESLPFTSTPPATPNTAPVAVSSTNTHLNPHDHIRGLLGQLNATDADGDELRYSIAAGPTVGQLYVNPWGGYTWIAPHPGYSGTVSFTFEVWDGQASSTAVQTLVVEAWDGMPPIVSDLNVTGQQDSPIVGSLTATNSPNLNSPGAIVFGVISPPASGTVTIDNYGRQFVYTPAAGFTGTVTFTYNAWDGQTSNTATVTIVVEAALEPESWTSADESAPTSPAVHVKPSVQFYVALASGTTQTVTVVVESTNGLNVRAIAPESLTLQSTPASDFPAETAVVSRYRFADVNDDGREDLVAVFELDWESLLDGTQSAAVTGTLL